MGLRAYIALSVMQADRYVPSKSANVPSRFVSRGGEMLSLS